MKNIDELLNKIEQSIRDNVYQSFESEAIELKDLSTGENWKELYKTVNAFLNTRGGIVIIGIKENPANNTIKFTGYNDKNEPKLKELPKIFSDENEAKLDLSEYINPENFQIRQFLDGKVAIINVEKLPEERKFAYYDKIAYHRMLTGDHQLSKDAIQAHNEWKSDYKAIELKQVPEATVNDLDIDKLNEYIDKLNSGIKVENNKKDISEAMSFLSRKKMIREGKPTIFGMLVCGRHIYDFLRGRCAVDAYFETGNKLADDVKNLRDNIINLLESSWAFTSSKIEKAISTNLGGEEISEYPQDIIRETINNALAHRDYSSDRFSILRVKNKEYFEIRNPGKFLEEQILCIDNSVKVRRIIPNPKPKNPNLADVLKVYRRWEGRGIGMATLTKYALENKIDMPYYRLYNENEVGTYIQSGKVLDAAMEAWLAAFEKYIYEATRGKGLSSKEKIVLAYLYKSELLNARELYTINLTPDNNHFSAINSLLDYGLIKEVDINNRYIKLYKVNETLKKNDFSSELLDIFGNAYKELSKDYRDVLQTLYLLSNYSMTNAVKAGTISTYIYEQTHSVEQYDIREIDTFARKVRNIVNTLLRKNFIRRKAGNNSGYEINSDFEY